MVLDLLDWGSRARLLIVSGGLGEEYPAFLRTYGAAQDAARVSQKLLESAEDKAEVFGENYWLVLLYRSLTENQGFCDGGFEVIRG